MKALVENIVAEIILNCHKKEQFQEALENSIASNKKLQSHLKWMREQGWDDQRKRADPTFKRLYREYLLDREKCIEAKKLYYTK